VPSMPPMGFHRGFASQALAVETGQKPPCTYQRRARDGSRKDAAMTNRPAFLMAAATVSDYLSSSRRSRPRGPLWMSLPHVSTPGMRAARRASSRSNRAAAAAPSSRRVMRGSRRQAAFGHRRGQARHRTVGDRANLAEPGDRTRTQICLSAPGPRVQPRASDPEFSTPEPRPRRRSARRSP
jgi:hypothetical protein